MKKVFMNGLDFYQNPKMMILNILGIFWTLLTRPLPFLPYDSLTSCKKKKQKKLMSHLRDFSLQTDGGRDKQCQIHKTLPILSIST